jgi:hypothetical protein
MFKNTVILNARIVISPKYIYSCRSVKVLNTSDLEIEAKSKKSQVITQGQEDGWTRRAACGMKACSNFVSRFSQFGRVNSATLLKQY